MKLRVSLCQFWALFNKMLIVFELDWHENTAQRGASVSRCCRGCWVRWRWFMGDLSWSTNTQHEARCSTISLDPSITLKTVWVVKWKVLFIKLTDFLFEQCFWRSAFSWSLIVMLMILSDLTLFYTTFLHHTGSKPEYFRQTSLKRMKNLKKPEMVAWAQWS